MWSQAGFYNMLGAKSSVEIFCITSRQMKSRCSCAIAILGLLLSVERFLLAAANSYKTRNFQQLLE